MRKENGVVTFFISQRLKHLNCKVLFRYGIGILLFICTIFSIDLLAQHQSFQCPTCLKLFLYWRKQIIRKDSILQKMLSSLLIVIEQSRLTIVFTPVICIN